MGARGRGCEVGRYLTLTLDKEKQNVSCSNVRGDVVRGKREGKGR